MTESGIFPTSMTAYVRTGEETGCLDEIMEQSQFRTMNRRKKSQDRYESAVTYPLLMLGMMAVVILVLLDKSPAGISTGI